MTTETTKHTPGPWKITNGVDIWPDDCDMEGMRHIAHCTPSGYDCDECILQYDEVIANARIIAAAPELLEACTELLDTVDYLMHNEGNADKCARISIGGAIAAIAKATGEGVE